MFLANEVMKIKISQLKKDISTIKIKEKNSTIETKFDKYSNKVSMFETVKEFDRETVTRKTLNCQQGITPIHSNLIMLRI